jgi:tRNA A37 threonylcarbamoyladenosine synthetase subunit TsaC/SUA5/YrdC
VPDHALLIELLRRTGPLATTSANRHGRRPATTAVEAAADLGAEVDAILDGGPAGGLASTIIDCTLVPPHVLREGPVSATELLALIWEHGQPPARRTPSGPTTRMHRK